MSDSEGTDEPAGDESTSTDEAAASDTDEAPGSAEGAAATEPDEAADADVASDGVDEPVGDAAETGDETQGETEAAVADRVADADPDEIAREIRGLRERVDDLELEREELAAERDDLESRLKRVQADFQNYKKRQEKRREEVRQRATETLVERLLEVRDNLDRALAQDDDADIREGVAATRRLLDDAFDAEGVSRIEPAAGDPVDPQRHEVLLRVDSDEPADTIAELHRPGYEMADKVLRPAQVTVSDGPPTEAEDDADADAGDAAEATGPDTDGE